MIAARPGGAGRLGYSAVGTAHPTRARKGRAECIGSCDAPIQRMLDPGCYRCSGPSLAKHSPPDSGPLKSASFRAGLRIGLGGSIAQRTPEFLSKAHSLSEAWGLAHLLYKLFWQPFQPLSLVAYTESWYPVRPPFSATDPANSLKSPQAGQLDRRPAAGHGRRGLLLGRDILERQGWARTESPSTPAR
jgi:hypothetical protein